MNSTAHVGSGVSIFAITNLELVSRVEHTPEPRETMRADPTEECSGGTRRTRAIRAAHPAATPARVDAARIQRREARGAL